MRHITTTGGKSDAKHFTKMHSHIKNICRLKPSRAPCRKEWLLRCKIQFNSIIYFKVLTRQQQEPITESAQEKNNRKQQKTKQKYNQNTLSCRETVLKGDSVFAKKSKIMIYWSVCQQQRDHHMQTLINIYIKKE
jgi:hypothetical protein